MHEVISQMQRYNGAKLEYSLGPYLQGLEIGSNDRNW